MVLTEWILTWLFVNLAFKPMDRSMSKTETPMPGRNQHRRAAPEQPLAGEAQTGDRFVLGDLQSVSVGRPCVNVESDRQEL
jgi:hypothetical protein